MRLTKLALRGITTFTSLEPTVIDFTECGEGLVALVGRNGAGKTSLIEAPLGALYKSLPSRPASLYEAAHGRDAFIAAFFEDDRGNEIEVRVSIDAEARKTEAYVIVNGVSQTSGRAVEFDAEVERRFGSRSLLLASIYSVQNKSGSFLQMPRSERKGLFIELLALGVLEVHTEAAKQQRAIAEAQYAQRRQQLTALESETAQLPVIETQVASARKKLEAEELNLDVARVAESLAVEQLARARAAAQEIGALEEAATGTLRELATAEKAVADITATIKRTQDMAEQRVKFIDANRPEQMEAAAMARRDGQLARIRREADAQHAVISVSPAPEECDALRIGLDEAKQQAAEQQRRQARVIELTGSVRTAEAQHRAAEQRVEQALAHQLQQISTEKQRAALIDSVPCAVQPTWLGPTPGKPVALANDCPLLANAREARERLAQLEAMDFSVERLAMTEAAEKLAGLRNTLTQLGESTGALDWSQQVERIQAQLAKEPMARAAHSALARLATEELDVEAQYTADIEAARAEHDRISSELDAIKREMIETLGGLAVERDAAIEAHAAARDRNEAAARKLSEARAAIADPSAAAKECEAAKQRREGAERNVRIHATDLAAHEALLARLNGQAAEQDRVRTAMEYWQSELEDWTLLTEALGKDGIQALEIDAAGPEVARLTNDLLESCYGPRFSISFETQRAKRDGGMSEAFDVLVYDGAEQRPVEALSGGERVIVGEAISLALAIHNARKSGIRWRTLFRDETAGALDPENASKYVAMLRRALKLGGFEQCVFVAHLPQVYESADVQLYVADGRVSVGRAA